MRRKRNKRESLLCPEDIEKTPTSKLPMLYLSRNHSYLISVFGLEWNGKSRGIRTCCMGGVSRMMRRMRNKREEEALRPKVRGDLSVSELS